MMPPDGAHVALWQHGVALALVMTDVLARAGRSRALMPVRFARAIVVNCCGDAVASMTPARIGGEPIRFVGYTRSGLGGPTVLASFATETMLDVIILGTGAVLVGPMLARAGWHLMERVAPLASAGAWTAAVFVAGAVCVAALVIRRRYPRTVGRVTTFLSESWHRFRNQPSRAVALAGVCTIVSLAARLAILPVLLANTPGLEWRSLALGSVAALYVLLLTPTPGGIGLVELGFFAGLGDALDPRQVAMLLVAWRSYTWLIGAGVGGLLLLRERRAHRRLNRVVPA